MEGLLMSAATGALKPVLEKLTALMGVEYKCFKGARREVQSLTDELAAMHTFLLKMSEEEHPDPQDKAWMKEVRELSYDMEDSLDEFMLRVDDKSVSPEGFIDKFKNFLTKAKTRRKIAKAIEDLKVQAKEVGDRNRRYRSNDTIMNTSNAAVDHRALAIFEDASKLVGIDGPKDELIKWLAREYKCVASEPREVVPPKVVSIVGFGGMGKTTLANHVYVELKNQFDFDCWAFVSVSRNPDLMKILRTLLSEVSNGPYQYTEAGSIQQLIGRITDFLKDKRYLIVVDDVWKIETWDIIRYALFPDKEKSIIIPDKEPSTVITTTRIHDVAKACCSSYGTLVYKMRPLIPTDSKKLFRKRIFGSHHMCPSHLEEVSNKILEKCDGLPLAIISISGLLANKPQTNYQWNRVQNSFGRELGRNPEVQSMVQILSLSYVDLPHHLKTCLLYLSTFREDSVIDKRRLIRRWIAEGFIQEEQGHTRYELGERCFNDLINRSLIQAQDLNMYGEVTVCQVHDTILDFIISKSEEENFVNIFSDGYQMPGPHRKVRRLSLLSNSVENVSQLKKLDLTHLRSVTVFTYAPEALLLFMNFSSLRVLDLGGCTQVEGHHLANIGNLFRLKYLSLRNTEVCELPEQIRKLQHLETLDISMGKARFFFFEKEKSRKLPASIVELKRLAHLVLDIGVILPAGIRSMTALEELESVDVSKQSIDFAQDLGQLTYLRSISFFLGCNGYKNFDAAGSSCEEYMDIILLSLSKLGNLRSLSFHVVSDYFSLGTVSCAPHGLQKLEIKMGFISKVPNWVGSLVNLQTLVIFVCQFEVEDFMALGRLPALVFLHLIAHESFCGTRFTISGDYGFHCLRHFDFGCVMPVMFGVGAMPKLEKLTIMFSPERMGGTEDFHFGIEHLSSLDRVDCVFHLSGDSVVVRTAKTPMANMSFRGGMDRILNQVVSTTCDLETAASSHAKSPELKFRHTLMWMIED
ncbi:Disease resistance protein RPM1 [Dichanthelium oligosanthes]|uniref:Disease resistance protein RPM1 n=1 Tax=Dichanthelium oligosanthes TaxID=888268 RepID=A0A1E5WHE3_9POAL|nr:Disease resistance protein RPM1 [Dichanthelium oligosanthes]